MCLRKDAKQRVGDIRDVRLALEGAFETGVSQAVAAVAVPQAAVWRRALPVAAALAIGVLATGAAWYLTRPAAPPVTRTAILTTGAAALTLSGVDRDIALTPDGRRVVYRGANGALSS